MKNIETQRGFTLVELAIVMTIIGLLIGGVLKGQELIKTARVTATIAQVRAFEAAITTFRDSYDTLPGDMGNADQRIPGCSGLTACNAAATWANNGVVGGAASGLALNAYPLGMGTTTKGAASTAADETYLFWNQLGLDNLISGISDQSLRTPAAFAWGVSHPAAKVGGGFIVDSVVATLPGAPAGTSQATNGLTLYIVATPITNPVTTAQGAEPLSAALAAQIDRKIDDGRPNTGYALAYGVTATCFGPIPASPSYVEATAGNDCGLAFRIQG